MEATHRRDWHPRLADPSGRRTGKPRTEGLTMVIDKGLGFRAFEDLLESAAPYIDMLKIGFGTSPLYPEKLLREKIERAKANGICIYPGGTFLEVAISQGVIDDYFDRVIELGFNGIEISNGTIDFGRGLRNRLIARAVEENLTVITEYGKKSRGSTIELPELVNTIMLDLEFGSSLVTIEGRESGTGVGIYDDNGECNDELVERIARHIPNRHVLMWEAPQKAQQVHLMKKLGTDINIGNVPPQDVIALEALRRGLRSDTFSCAAAGAADARSAPRCP
jgi:phosphosulfolactate synthase